jgi:uncharacterized protein
LLANPNSRFQKLEAGGLVLLNFDSCCESLVVSGLILNPAEVQGALCGRLAGGRNLDGKEILEFIAGNFSYLPESLLPIEEVLHNIYDDTVMQIRDQQKLIELLLPQDDEELTVRLAALSDWCRSYLLGLGQSGLTGNSVLAPDAVEAMRDLAAVAAVDLSNLQDDDEVSYFELVEFVKVASALIQVELVQHLLRQERSGP